MDAGSGGGGGGDRRREEKSGQRYGWIEGKREREVG
jgi:hypothetical protein